MAIAVRNLTKLYGTEKAVNDISFDVKTGEILGFLGPNGAGKTTTMKIITCYMPPTSGMVEVEGLDIAEHSFEVRKKIGYLPEMNPLYLDMNVVEYLEYSARLHGLKGVLLRSRLKEMIDVCGIADVRHKDIGELSKGFRQRVGLAQAMIHDPEVLILDEPTSGLDPNQIVEIRNLIRQLGRAKTVVLSTHILSEVQATCDRVIIINEGTIVADGTLEQLQQDFRGSEKISLELKTRATNAMTEIYPKFKDIHAC
jgi:ABC-2 type transport system ATP-binding protein